MVLTVTLAIMTSDKSIESSQRFIYSCLLLVVNLFFFIFWIVFYLKIQLGSLSNLKLFKNLLDWMKKKALSSRIIKAISYFISKEKKKNYKGIHTIHNSNRKIVKLNFRKIVKLNFKKKKQLVYVCDFIFS